MPAEVRLAAAIEIKESWTAELWAGKYKTQETQRWRRTETNVAHRRVDPRVRNHSHSLCKCGREVGLASVHDQGQCGVFRDGSAKGGQTWSWVQRAPKMLPPCSWGALGGASENLDSIRLCPFEERVGAAAKTNEPSDDTNDSDHKVTPRMATYTRRVSTRLCPSMTDTLITLLLL